MLWFIESLPGCCQALLKDSCIGTVSKRVIEIMVLSFRPRLLVEVESG